MREPLPRGQNPLDDDVPEDERYLDGGTCAIDDRGCPCAAPVYFEDYDSAYLDGEIGRELR